MNRTNSNTNSVIPQPLPHLLPLHSPLHSPEHSPLHSPEHSPKNSGRIGKYSRRKFYNKQNYYQHDIVGPGERKSIDILEQQVYFDNIRDHRENFIDFLVLPTNIELPIINILNLKNMKNKTYNNNLDHNNLHIDNYNSFESSSILTPSHSDIVKDHNQHHHYTPKHDYSYNHNVSSKNKSYGSSDNIDDNMINNNNNVLVTPMNKHQLHEVNKTSSLYSKRYHYRSKLKKEFV